MELRDIGWIEELLSQLGRNWRTSYDNQTDVRRRRAMCEDLHPDETPELFERIFRDAERARAERLSNKEATDGS